MQSRIGELERRLEDLEKQVADPERATKPDYPNLLRELGSLQKVLEPWRRYVDLDRQIAETKEMAAEEDEEIRDLALEELPALEEEYQSLEASILDRVLDADQNGDRPAIVEIRAGTGGEEAALFAGDLFRIYSRFAETQSWSLEVMDNSESDMGGYKEIIFKVTGDSAFRLMRFETGGHRVQRVPATETQGRIHTSAATVAVLPEVEEVDFELNPDELEITAMRSSGPGGQHVNKTSSAIRVVHLPTGMAVKCQEDKSQHRNKAKAMAMLRARLYELEKQKKDAERSDMRRNQVGSGDRSQRIRTYNWPQNRVTDHRTGRNFSLEQILEGRLQDLLDSLLAAEREAKLASL
ncbi:MAG: peptide chain release factor 1 [Planctomycetota bacterium]|nr:MAG: peptide chain release factor 1 [Planctomycetota bacterium]